MANLLTGCWLDFVLNFRCTLISGQLSKRLGMGNGKWVGGGLRDGNRNYKHTI